jgi:anti-anti-sigma factor
MNPPPWGKSRREAPVAFGTGRAAVGVVRPEGELGRDELAEVGAELFRQVARGRIRLVLDLSAVPHLDYRGVPSIAARARLLRVAGGDVKLAGVSEYLASILTAGGGHGAFECHPTVEAAIRSFDPPVAQVA